MRIKEKKSKQLYDQHLIDLKLFLVVLILICAFSCYFQENVPILTDQSYGLITYGNKIEDIEDKLGTAKRQNSNYDCDYVTFEKYPGIKFMIEKGIVTRADVINEIIPNALGINISMTFSDVLKKHPAVIIEPHQYTPRGHYLIFKSSDGKRAYVFEEVGGKITQVRAGLEPSVQYVEGCL